MPETAVLYLFVVASLLSVLANRFHIPYTVALVLGGLVLGALHLSGAHTDPRSGIHPLPAWADF